MSKLKVVSREAQEKSRRKLEEMEEKDPVMKEHKNQIERDFAEEKARRDAEYASKESESKQKEVRTMAATFELYKDRAEEYRWRLRHENGNIIADSGEGYTTKTNAINGIDSVKENAPTAPIEDQTT